VTPCSEDGGTVVFGNADILPQPRRPRLEARTCGLVCFLTSIISFVAGIPGAVSAPQGDTPSV